MLIKINSILLSMAMLFCSQDVLCSDQQIPQIGSPYNTNAYLIRHGSGSLFQEYNEVSSIQSIEDFNVNHKKNIEQLENIINGNNKNNITVNQIRNTITDLKSTFNTINENTSRFK